MGVGVRLQLNHGLPSIGGMSLLLSVLFRCSPHAMRSWITACTSQMLNATDRQHHRLTDRGV